MTLRVWLTAFALSTTACGGYDPCGDLECGDPCTACDPDDASCVETPVQKVCNRNAVCVEAQPPICG
mgnify:CR=1 FL=1